MNLISISTDRNILKEGSAVRERQVAYAALCDDVHIIIFSRRSHGPAAQIQIAPRAWVHTTASVSRFFYTIDALRIARRIIRHHSYQPRNTVITTQDPFETGRVGLALRREFGLPLHVQIHTDFLSPYFKKVGGFGTRFLNWYRIFLAWGTLKHAAAIRVVSQKIADSLSAQKKLVLGARPHVLPIFVDVAAISNEAVLPPADLHTKYPQFDFIALMATRLTTEKNIPLALQAFARATQAHPRAGLVIVGDGPEKNALKKLVQKLGIAPRVVFEPWQQSVVSYQKTADLFLSTSWYEGYGLSMVEAAAAGCPVVATDAGVARDLFSSPEFSSVCPPGDLACLTEKIATCIEDAALRRAIAAHARHALARVTAADKQAYLTAYQESIKKAL